MNELRLVEILLKEFRLTLHFVSSRGAMVRVKVSMRICILLNQAYGALLEF
jgi:hypothetical protein